MEASFQIGPQHQSGWWKAVREARKEYQGLDGLVTYWQKTTSSVRQDQPSEAVIESESTFEFRYESGEEVNSRRNFGFATGILNGLPGVASGTAIFLVGALKQSVGFVQIMFYGAAGAILCALLVLVTATVRFDQEHCWARSEPSPIGQRDRPR